MATSKPAVQILCVMFLLTQTFLILGYGLPSVLTVDTLLWAARFHFVLGVFTVVGTLFYTAPYGKHATTALPDPMLSARVGWIVQECPTILAVVLSVFRHLDAQKQKMKFELDFETTWLQDITWWIHPALSVLSPPIRMFLLHYVHRTMIFPFRFNSNNPSAFRIVFAANLYCCFNGALQAVAVQPAKNHLRPPSIMELNDAQYVVALAGCAIFFFGMYLNIMSDNALINLRKDRPGKVPKAVTQLAKERQKNLGDTVQNTSSPDKRYKIPTGFWAFDFVSCPNFLGEMIEWCGYALVATAFATSDFEGTLGYRQLLIDPWLALVGLAEPNAAAATSLAAWSFAFYTAANTAPRGISHHKWYLKTFGDEYKQLRRKAVIPFLV